MFPASAVDFPHAHCKTLPTHMVANIKKRDARIVEFDQNKITEAIWKAVQSVGGKDQSLAEKISNQVVAVVEVFFKNNAEPPHVEQIQDLIEKILIENGHAKTAKSFILYRQERAEERRKKLLKEKNVSEKINWGEIDEILMDGLHSIENIKEAKKHIESGIHGFADILSRVKLPYTDEEASALAQELASFIHEQSIKFSGQANRFLPPLDRVKVEKTEKNGKRKFEEIIPPPIVSLSENDPRLKKLATIKKAQKQEEKTAHSFDF